MRQTPKKECPTGLCIATGDGTCMNCGKNLFPSSRLPDTKNESGRVVTMRAVKSLSSVRDKIKSKQDYYDIHCGGKDWTFTAKEVIMMLEGITEL